MKNVERECVFFPFNFHVFLYRKLDQEFIKSGTMAKESHTIELRRLDADENDKEDDDDDDDENVRRRRRRKGTKTCPFLDEITGIKLNTSEWPTYIRLPATSNVKVEQLTQLIQDDWKLKRPQIILTIISDFERLEEWGEDHEKHIEDLITGLGKTVTSARTWLITNGIDSGSSMMMAKSLDRIKLWQKTIEKRQTNAFQSVCIGKETGFLFLF